MQVINNEVEKWDVFEIEIKSVKSFQNPFKDVNLEACFVTDTSEKRVAGFYDGDSTWKIRFMPEKTGRYEFFTASDNDEFDGLKGSFKCIDPSPDNHGPVKVDKVYHFSYADGIPFFVMGTTAYAWTYRPENIRIKTLESLNKYRFNKVRMVFFPQHLNFFDEVDLSYDPPLLPYEGESGYLDFSRPKVEYFKNYEDRIKELLKLGIQADVILFHSYDFGKWGVDAMNDEEALFYLKYLIARLAAYRNIWWSLANEYDIVTDPILKLSSSNTAVRDWIRLGTYIMETDPYGHLRSVHNFGPVFPNCIWLTHVSYQHPNTYTMLMDLKKSYGKPVIDDEYQYEGNLSYAWGNSLPETEFYSHWLSVMAGGYATHGECYKVDGNKKDIFWTYGGEMVGESAPRLKFLREILETVPFQEMTPDHASEDGFSKFCLKKGSDVYLYLLTETCKKRWVGFYTENGDDCEYEATVFDIWNMTILSKSIEKAGGKDFNNSGWIVIRLQRIIKE